MNTSEQGSLLFELLVAIAILSIAAIGLAGGITSTTRLSSSSGELDRIKSATRNVIETLKEDDFRSLITTYAGDAGRFSCNDRGEVAFGTQSGDIVGRVLLHNREDSLPATFTGLGSSLDLNADGVIDSNPVSDYHILPVTVIIDVSDGNDTREIRTEVLISRSEVL